ncbi:MAG: hypothetical protein K2P81_06465 [Bacteriovoracaceae bacterium]|nr:hypothetical protein [Bacteriovoracaceae bacterium]
MPLKTLPWMVFVAGLLSLAASAFALDINEELPNIRLLAVYPGNIVVLNRGVEDGVAVGTHAKLRASEGYASRALCVKVGMLTSHWRLYRIVESQLISKDLTYSLIGMDASEAPTRVEEWQRINHDKIVPSFDEKKLLPEEKKEVTEIKSDLPEELSKDEAFLDSQKSAARLLVERNYDPERLKRDFQKINGNIYASPWSTQKGGNTDIENVRYGAKLANEGTKYIFAAGLDRRVLRAKESKTNEKVINEGTEANIRLTVKELSPGWDAYSDITYRQARFGEVSTPKSHYLFAPLGFTHHYAEGKTLKKISLSYAPTYDSRVHEGYNDSGKRKEFSKSGLRHALRLYMLMQFTEDFSITSDFSWRPMQDLSSWRIDLADNLAQEKLTASMRLVKSLFVDYELQWLDDAQLHRINHLPRVVTTNSLNIRYNFDF